MVYRKNPENTSTGRPGSVYGQEEAENRAFGNSSPVHTSTGKTVISQSFPTAGFEKFDGIMKMYNDYPVRRGGQRRVGSSSSSLSSRSSFSSLSSSSSVSSMSSSQSSISSSMSSTSSVSSSSSVTVNPPAHNITEALPVKMIVPIVIDEGYIYQTVYPIWSENVPHVYITNVHPGGANFFIFDLSPSPAPNVRYSFIVASVTYDVYYTYGDPLPSMVGPVQMFYS